MSAVEKRVTALRRLKSLAAFAEASKTDADKIIDFETRYERLSYFMEEFERYHYEVLEDLTEKKEIEKQDEYRAEADELYFQIRKAYRILVVNSKDIKNEKSESSTSGSNIKLPKIDLPKFDASNLKMWPTFYELYNQLIHLNSSLSAVEKFQYLLSSLAGEPLSLLKAFPLSEENYSEAYKTLVERYQNKRRLAFRYYEELLSVKLTGENHRSYGKLLDVFSENLILLENLGLPTKQWDFVLFHLLLSKLDISIRQRFERQQQSNDIPSFNSLKSFVQNHRHALESIDTYTPKQTLKNSSPNYSKYPAKQTSLVVNSKLVSQNNYNCTLCKLIHPISKCPEFLKRSPTERYNIVKSNNLCLNCLGLYHSVKNCKSSFNCSICALRHNSLLHFERSSDTSTQALADRAITPQHIAEAGPTEALAVFRQPTQRTVLLSTVQLCIIDCNNKTHKVRGLIDNGSQASFITESLVNKLKLKRNVLSTPIVGIGQNSLVGNHNVEFKMFSGNNQMLVVNAIVLPKICSALPSNTLITSTWDHLRGLDLADPQFYIPGEIEILLGADIYAMIILDGVIRGKENEPIAINTSLGYILSGKIDIALNKKIQSFCTVVDNNIEIVMRKFWELENIPQEEHHSPEDVQCEKIFVDTIARNETGRYIVSLPFRLNKPSLGDSYTTALNRFFSLEKRLLKNPLVYKSYCDFMQNYLDENHMSLIENSVNKQAYYIPHHCISNAINSKFRVVFNASQKTLSNISLNDSLLIGPKLQKDIGHLLLSFRYHAIVFSADIRQMYRQILVKEAHRPYQTILWRFTPNESIKEYALNTVTYGVNSAPFLALRTLNQLAKDEQNSFPLASAVLNSDVYVDDIITGSDTVDAALVLQRQLIGLLQRGGFELRKWTSNSDVLLEKVPIEHQQPVAFDNKNENAIKILGLQWNPGSDSFSYSWVNHNEGCTKRIILSEIARIFDPLGFLSPLTFLAKHLMQLLWTLKLDWDVTPPLDIVESWNKYKRELPYISNIKLPRRVIVENYDSIELHGFGDASSKGYGCVIYFRCIKGTTITIHFVCAKSKVAPLKNISIPRLELCAAVLLADLIKFVLKVYQNKIMFSKIFAWSDSTVALSWLISSPHRWKPFVANRISHVQDIVPVDSWFYISTQENPSDCSSRGLYPLDLINNASWWAGPSWLSLPMTEWPNSETFSTKTIPGVGLIEERKLVLNAVLGANFIEELINHFSSLSKIERIVAYCFRFFENIKNGTFVRKGHLVLSELNRALLCLIKQVQFSSFEKEISMLKKGSKLPKSFRKLSPFLDSNNFIRVGGRLKNADLSYDSKHPYLLPNKHRLIDLLIEKIHKDNCHPGLNTTNYLLRQRFWILGARRAIDRVLHGCLNCFRVKPKPYTPKMGDLPQFRVSQAKPFSYVGIDFAGPFDITLKRMRGGRTTKAYICIFVCSRVKAIHLELCSDLSSETFLGALRRFVARRGRCDHIFSDNGTNFCGANNLLVQYAKNASEKLAIKWKFNIPTCSHQGGLFEAGVKSVKTHLARTIGNQILTYEELYTVLTQVEALLNSRPLCPASSDPNDFSALTPGHFLTLEPLSAVPDSDLSDTKVSLLSRWQFVQYLNQQFWKRWHVEYLHTLQQRQKWNKPSCSVKTDTLVILQNDNCKPLYWDLGRITKVYDDRFAEVRTKSGSYKRPLTKLYPLPNQD